MLTGDNLFGLQLTAKLKLQYLSGTPLLKSMDPSLISEIFTPLVL